MFDFTLHAMDGAARTGTFATPHGNVETPVFMPVGTNGSVKGVSPEEVEGTGVSMILANTYHLYLRPGHELVRELGGVHEFMRWEGPILTDSGGYQVFSLSGTNKIRDDGVVFQSHIDGSSHLFTPEGVMDIQRALGADVVMAFDQCAPGGVSRKEAEAANRRTLDWLSRCRDRFQVLHDDGGGETKAFSRSSRGTFTRTFAWSTFGRSSISGTGTGWGSEDSVWARRRTTRGEYSRRSMRRFGRASPLPHGCGYPTIFSSPWPVDVTCSTAWRRPGTPATGRRGRRSRVRSTSREPASSRSETDRSRVRLLRVPGMIVRTSGTFVCRASCSVPGSFRSTTFDFWSGSPRSPGSASQMVPSSPGHGTGSSGTGVRKRKSRSTRRRRTNSELQHRAEIGFG